VVSTAGVSTAAVAGEAEVCESFIAVYLAGP